MFPFDNRCSGYHEHYYKEELMNIEKVSKGVV
jgi:hypothetical protein